MFRFTFPFFKCIFRRKLTISCMTSILQNLSHFDQQLWPQSSPVSLYHPLSPPITPFAPLFWTFWPHVSISSRLQNVNPSIDTPWTSQSLDFSWSLVFNSFCLQTWSVCTLVWWTLCNGWWQRMIKRHRRWLGPELLIKMGKILQNWSHTWNC